MLRPAACARTSVQRQSGWQRCTGATDCSVRPHPSVDQQPTSAAPRCRSNWPTPGSRGRQHNANPPVVDRRKPGGPLKLVCRSAKSPDSSQPKRMQREAPVVVCRARSHSSDQRFVLGRARRSSSRTGCCQHPRATGRAGFCRHWALRAPNAARRVARSRTSPFASTQCGRAIERPRQGELG